MDGGGKIKRWILVAQPWALPASASPALIGLSYAFYLYSTGVVTEINWTYGIIAFFGTLIFHMSGNILGDYHDYMSGVDVKEKTGPPRPLVLEMLKPRQALVYGYTMLVIGMIIGIYLLVHTGCRCYSLHHRGNQRYTILQVQVRCPWQLIFICYGLAIAWNGYVMTGQLAWPVLLVTPGLLIVAIPCNNTICCKTKPRGYARKP